MEEFKVTMHYTTSVSMIVKADDELSAEDMFDNMFIDKPDAEIAKEMFDNREMDYQEAIKLPYDSSQKRGKDILMKAYPNMENLINEYIDGGNGYHGTCSVSLYIADFEKFLENNGYSME